MALTKITGQVINTATDVTVGVLTVTDTLAIGGTVSIGGTLTYEDVTNVDAIGIITARSGINVSGGQLDVGSNIELGNAGVITATRIVSTIGSFGGDTAISGSLQIADTIQHEGDVNTKIRFPANDTISFETGGSERLRTTSDGELLVNTITVSPHIRLNQKLGVAYAGNYGGASLTNYGGTTAANKPLLDFNRSRGTSNASMTIVASGDGLGHIVFRGADGTNFVDSAAIRADVDGTPGTNDMPGRLVFETTADGSDTLSPRLTIDSTGHLLHGVTASEDTTGNSGTKLITTGDLQIDGDQKAIVFRSTASTAQKQSGLQWWNENGAGVQCAIFGIREAVSQAPGALAFYTSDNVDSSSNNGEGEITERFRIDSSGHVLPGANDTYDLGSSSKRWRDIYTGDLNLSNKGKSNDVDGSWGDYTIQEGESDLFLINNRSGKKFKFNLTEVL